MRLRPGTVEDAAAIAEIYAPYVTGSGISFEIEAPDAFEMARRMEAGADLYPWLVAEAEDERLAGYAYSAAFRARPAYRFTVETSVYLRPDAQGQGVATQLYDSLIELLTAQGFTQAIAAIALPNEASVRFHERLLFRPAGTYEKVGWKLGQWRDVGLWQRALATPSDPPAEPRPWTLFQSILT